MTGITQYLIYLDRSAFQGINSLAGKFFLLDWLARLGADDHIIPITLVLLTLLVVLLARDREERRAAFSCVICAALAVAVSMVILYALNSMFFRPRPFTSRGVTLLFYNNTDSAFPSNAATLSFALAFTVLFYRRSVGAAMLALAAFQGIARVMVGIHYPLDIIGGALLGGAGAMIARTAEPAYRPVANAVNAALDRLFASWRRVGAAEPRGGGSP